MQPAFLVAVSSLGGEPRGRRFLPSARRRREARPPAPPPRVRGRRASACAALMHSVCAAGRVASTCGGSVVVVWLQRPRLRRGDARRDRQGSVAGGDVRGVRARRDRVHVLRVRVRQPRHRQRVGALQRARKASRRFGRGGKRAKKKRPARRDERGGAPRDSGVPDRRRETRRADVHRGSRGSRGHRRPRRDRRAHRHHRSNLATQPLDRALDR